MSFIIYLICYFDLIDSTTISREDFHLILGDSSKILPQKNLEDDVFIRTLQLMTCHQVLMERQTMPGSKLITIFDPSDGVFMTNLLCCVCSETKSLCLFHFSLSYVNHLSSHTLSEPCSKTQEGKKIIIYYGPLSTLTWSSIFFHHCALPVHGQLEK